MNGEAGKVDTALMSAAEAAAPLEFGTAAGMPPASAAPAAPNWRMEARSIWQCVAGLAVVFPSLRPIYTPETLDGLADAWAPILQKHNFTVGEFMMYFVAAGATIPVVAATVQAIRADLAAAKRAEPAKPAADKPIPPAADQPGPPNRPLQ